MLSRPILVGLATLLALAGCNGDSVSSELPATSTSTITSNVSSLYADGVSTATVTVTLRDKAGMPIPTSAGTVTMATTGGFLGPVHDNGDGTYQATLTAALETGKAFVTARLDGRPLDARLNLVFVAGPPTVGRWFTPSTWLYADGQSRTELTFMVEDERARRVSLPPGALTMVTTAGTLSAVSGTGDSAYQAQLTSTATDQTAVVSARLNNEVFGPSLAVRFDHRHWVNAAPMAMPRMSVAGAVMEGQLYAVGGSTGWDQGLEIGDLEVFNPSSNRWTALAPMPTARTDLAAGSSGGLLYAIGGMTTSIVGVLEAYDPATNTWSSLQPMPTPRAGLGVGVVNGVLYAIGGRTEAPASTNGSGAMLNDLPQTPTSGVVEAYNPASNTWTTMPPLPSARAHLAIGVINGLIYAVGGSDGTSARASLYVFDPSTSQWRSRAPMHHARSALAVAVLDGKLYAIGGFVVYSETRVVEVYDPGTDTWSEDAPLVEVRQAMLAGVLNGRIYSAGGACYDKIAQEMETRVP